ncbi:hypothetical protein AMTR_s00053p00184830 [Amborella trichopoda]|uniref:Uncharacterized protein n=1 Tax=Amborella trichopoda TaxID=13333 RepID=W1PDJ7_AMBTC|nr:hypothetical protein AMTR_s00053p00184830 [Amborella trichopoda]
MSLTMYPLPYRAVAVRPKAKVSKAKQRFDPLTIDPLAMVVTVPDEEAPSFAGSPDHVPNLQVGVPSFDPFVALVRSEGVDPLMVVSNSEHVRRLGPQLLDEDPSFVVSEFIEQETVVILEETEAASMVRDMGMDFNVPIGVFFAEVKRLKVARGTLGASSVAKDARKVAKEPQSAAKLNMKKPSLKKIPEVGTRSFTRMEAQGIIKKMTKPSHEAGKAPLFIYFS